VNREWVLDCSVAAAWVFADEATPDHDRLLDDLTLGARAWVPSLWHLELGNVLLGALRRGRIDQAGVEGFLSQLQCYDIVVDGETVERAWQKTLDLAQQYRLSTYDAAYLELALRRGVPLATGDGALAKAARLSGVGLVMEG
jgi:predicted nucleic acid-binding protein